MYLQPRESRVPDDFGEPVESIMRCEDFKSNFARRLSNRYTSKAPVSTPRKDVSLKPPEKPPDNVPERIERCSQLSTIIREQNQELKVPVQVSPTSDSMRRTEVTVLNMEVETLRWQLAQTEANREMHIALLKQVVTFLNRVKEHIECQQPDSRRDVPRALPRSFNLAEMPRSRSVLHVNKNLEYSISPVKKISGRKISKSISNVNGYKDCIGLWSQSKLSLSPETETSQKITEEISRLITLANTVLCTKLPDLACHCNDKQNDTIPETHVDVETELPAQGQPAPSLNLTVEDSSNSFILNTVCDNSEAFNNITNKFIDTKDNSLSNYFLSPSSLPCGLENDFVAVKSNGKEQVTAIKEETVMPSKVSKTSINFNSNSFVEDESGFSSMSSFQEIGIPIISIIPPSPCKEVEFMEDIPAIIEDTNKWSNESIEIDKQTVQVFWV